MKKNLTKITLLLLSLTMIAGLVVGCQTASPEETTEPTKEAEALSEPTEALDTEPGDPWEAEWNGEITTISIGTGLGTSSGPLVPWYAEYLEKKIGVRVDEVITMDQAVLSARLVAGNLSDVTAFNNYDLADQAVEGGQMLALTDYPDAIPDILANLSQAVQFQKDHHSNGTDKMYLIPHGVGPAMEELNSSWMVRWDYYKELGYPEIDSLEGILPIMKQMLDAHPENEAGQKNFGISVFSDWDSIVYYPKRATYYTIESPTAGKFLAVNVDTGELIELLDKDSEYMRHVHFMYEANQLGLLDPDSPTQGYSNVNEKLTAGRVMFSAYPNGSGFIGDDDLARYAHIGWKEQDLFIYMDNKVGQVKVMGIASYSKNIDAALRFVNLICSQDYALVDANGPKGLLWDIDEDDKLVLTDTYWNDYYPNPDEFVMPDGTPYSRVTPGWGSWELYPLTSAWKHSEYDMPVSLSYWPDVMAKKYTDNENWNTLWADWSAATGYSSTVDMLKDIGYYRLPVASTMLEAVPEDIKLTTSSICDSHKVYLWKMIFAKSEDEYNKLYEEMMTKIKELGYDDVVAYEKNAWNEANAIASKYE